jgi:hypothetical protein
MGETGSGKTYSVRFLQEICGTKAKIVTRVFDGGTIVSNIRQWIGQMIKTFDTSQAELLIFFFDEVNTAPCQWFIKELLVDRFLDGERIPPHVKFICAVNPYRKLNKSVEDRLRGLTQLGGVRPDSEMRQLVYKVWQMPESFMPFLLAADPPRDLPPGHPIDDFRVLTEHEKCVEKVVRKISNSPNRFHRKLLDNLDHWTHTWISHR